MLKLVSKLLKGAWFGLFLVEVSRNDISLLCKVSPPVKSPDHMGGGIWLGGGLANGIKEYLHQFSISFEHKITVGGGSGGSGGFLSILIARPLRDSIVVEFDS